MNWFKRLMQGLGWSILILAQAAAGMLLVFVFSLMLPQVDVATRGGWLISLLGIWVGFTVGPALVGSVVFSFRKTNQPLLLPQRWIFTALFVVIPLFILLPLGLAIEPGGEDTEFGITILDRWQPILAQAAWWLGILGFYTPSWSKKKK